MAKATRTTRGKKKRWLKIYSGKPFNQQLIGETNVADSNLAIGKPITVNLMNLTGDIKKQNTNIKFTIDAVSEGKAFTKVSGYEVISAALKRLVRRRSSKIDMSFDAVTSDGVKIRLKPFILTRGRTNNSVLTAIRKAVKESISKTVSNTGYQNIIQDLINHRFQVGMKKQLSKLHPIKIFEIKFLKVKEPKKEPVKKAKAKQPVKEEAKPVEKEIKKPEEKEMPAKEEAKPIKKQETEKPVKKEKPKQEKPAEPKPEAEKAE